MVVSSHSLGIWLTVPPILGDNVHKYDLSAPYCSSAPQFKDLYLHLTMVNFLDLVITCYTSDILNS